MSEFDDIEINPSLEVSIRVSVVTPDGGTSMYTFNVGAHSELANILVSLATRDSCGLTEVELDRATADLLGRQHVLLRREERQRYVPVWECREFDERDVVLAGYPKSGTTLMQMLMYQLTSDGDMGFEHMWHICPNLPEHGIMFPEFRALAFRSRPPRLFKSHAMHERLPRICKAIYVYRDPCDVVVSYYHHLISTREYSGDLASFVGAFLAGTERMLIWGTWLAHMRSWWRARTSPNVLFVSFDELTVDIASCAARIASWCGIDFDAATSARVVAACSFENMKRHAGQLDPRAGALKPEEFFRRGKLGTGADELSADDHARVRELVEVFAHEALCQDRDATHGIATPSWLACSSCISSR